jgi:hypothetical protein
MEEFKMLKNRHITQIFIAAVLLMVVGILMDTTKKAHSESNADWGPKWNAKGELVLPSDYHTWIFLGSPLTPHALNNNKAGFPEYHNVYIHPVAYQAYKKIGEFPEGTILLKELQLTLPGTNDDGSRIEASGRGFFPAQLNDIDISVKDSERFKDTNGWGFFNFGHHAPPYAENATVEPKEACASCHIANADNMVFKNFYAPILDAKISQSLRRTKLLHSFRRINMYNHKTVLVTGSSSGIGLDIARGFYIAGRHFRPPSPVSFLDLGV